MSKKKALGKGLSALLENVETDYHGGLSLDDSVQNSGSIDEVPINHIEANPFQPRIEFDEDGLIELAASIKEHGIIQPLTLRKKSRNNYQIISGERRFRACQLAGLKSVPSYIRSANDQTMLEMALIENIQREDLNAIEVSISFHRLIEECALTQQELGQKVGKKRSTVTNYLRLLKLQPEIQLAIKENVISMGHARALLGIVDEEKRMKIFNQLLDEDLSVRKLEAIVKEKSEKTKTSKKKTLLTPVEERIKESLSSLVRSKVNVRSSEIGSGRIEINYANQSELKRIAEKILP